MEADSEDIETKIGRLIEMGAEAAKAYKNPNNFGLSEVKQMALHLKLRTSSSKPELVDAIIAKKVHTERPIQRKPPPSIDGDLQDDDDVSEMGFVRDRNTMFRLVNFLMKSPAELQRTGLIASRSQLQQRQVGSDCPLFARVAIEFNSDDNSGGLLQQHEEFTKQNIDPEQLHRGFISARKVFSLWKDLQKRYATAVKKWAVSGAGNEQTFLSFCGKPNHGPPQLDVLYLRLVLNASNDSSLQSYCAEGSEVEGDLETSLATPISRMSSVTMDSTARKRSQDYAAVLAEESQKRTKLMEERNAYEIKVCKAITMKVRVETTAILSGNIVTMLKKIDTMQEDSDYDPQNPTESLLMYRAILQRLKEQYSELIAQRSQDSLNATP